MIKAGQVWCMNDGYLGAGSRLRIKKIEPPFVVVFDSWAKRREKYLIPYVYAFFHPKDPKLMAQFDRMLFFKGYERPDPQWYYKEVIDAYKQSADANGDSPRRRKEVDLSSKERRRRRRERRARRQHRV